MHRFPAELPAIAVARRAQTEWLAGLDLGPLRTRRLEDLLVVCSELVTNAVHHAPAGHDQPVVLRAEVDGADLCLEVEDGGDGFTWPADDRRAADVPAGEERGRGLLIVAALTDDLVVRRTDDGRNVVRCVTKDLVTAGGRPPRSPGAAPRP